MTEHASAAHALFDRDEIREVLETSFYRTDASEPSTTRPRPKPARTTARRGKARKPKPDHYAIICISMYVEDLAALDGKVASLKQRGHRRMTRSALIRYALERLAVEDVPKPSL